MESELVALSRELANLVDRVSPSVVVVEGRRHSYSSGTLWRKNLIVTAEHTLRRDDDITIVLPNGNRSRVKLVGRDPGTDVALLQGDNLDLPAIDPGPTAPLRAGEITLVVGRSPNSGPNVSMGIISAVSGTWRTWRGGTLDNYIRLDATIFPGLSGGAVVNDTGRLIGIGTSALSRIAGLAIPRTSIDKVVDALLKHGTVPHGYIGVGLQPVPLPEPLQNALSIGAARGLMVFSVEASGPAAQGGILIGDILLELDAKPLNSVENLQSFLTQDTIGKKLKLKIIRGGELREISITIAERGRGEES